ncbi:hypothetical protein AB0L14_17810 [Streptomyces sp. NPDC052727]|uniref:hypothetical protein n=1 Tax=Streptomyces sp. NPDC052727 TaxID=3154854 RepID=UPI0034395BF2
MPGRERVETAAGLAQFGGHGRQREVRAWGGAGGHTGQGEGQPGPAPGRPGGGQAPAEGVPGRLSWTARQDGTPEERLDVLHAWLVEDLPGGRARILTQETQIGRSAAELARQTPNPMLNGDQAWLDGLVHAARTA